MLGSMENGSICSSNASESLFVSGNAIWSQLQEIADQACPSGSSRLTEESSSSSSSAAESDSIGSGRNSSPEATGTGTKVSAGNLAARINEDKYGRLSPMVFSKPTHHKLKQQLMNGKLRKSPQNADLGYHSLSTQGTSLNSSMGGSRSVRATPTSSLESPSRSSPDLWDVRATKTPISDLHILTYNAKHLPVSKKYSGARKKCESVVSNLPSLFERIPDAVIVRILSFLTSNELVQCSRLSRRFYFLAWDPSLWNCITLTGEQTDADLALKTIIRLLCRNSATKLNISTIILGGCQQLTDRGLAIIARRCPQLARLEIQHCGNVTNGGLMDLVTKCTVLDHLDVTGCNMISTIGVHQPPPTTPSPHRGMIRRPSPIPMRRQLNLQFLDLTDCASLEDSGLKMIVESCPQLLYLFLRRCVNVTDAGIKYIAAYCLTLRELSISDCAQITDFGLYELAKLGPNLRYLSVAKCDQISDSGVKQIAKLCYKLRYLNVRGCEAVSDEAIETLAKSCSRLRSLDIGKCDVTDVGLKLLSEHCPNLKKLSVKSCEMVSDQGIQNVAYYCRGLQQLNIQDCPVTVEGYRTVKKFCRRCIIEHSNPGFF